MFAFAAALVLATSTAQAAVVTAIYTDDTGGDTLQFTFDDVTTPVGPVLTISVNGTNVPVGGAAVNELASIDSIVSRFGNLDLSFVNGGDILLVDDGGVGTSLGAFSAISGNLTLQSIPEPSTMAGIMLLSIAGFARRRRRVA